MTNNKDPDITIKLSQLVSLILGDSHSHPIPIDLAELIEIKSKDTYLCAIQWADKYDPSLKLPLLWNHSVWMASTEKWERARKRSHEQRVARFIEEANVRLVARQCKVVFDMDDNHANMLGLSLVRKKQLGKIKHLGIIKLIEREDEL